uniref:Adenosine deaminase domain-containing protein n=1 Tax=Myotis lucifugus TaxID=59463 RepID=G1Q2J3_MYOLU
VELHAHLNGSISSTMKILKAKKPGLNIHDLMTMIDSHIKRTLEECFQMFQIIYQPTTSPEDILMVTKDVIKEFADDGVKYLELRGTSRSENATGITKRTYVESVLESMKQSKEENLDVEVRYLISIDRRGGPLVAKETSKFSEEFFLSTEDTVFGLALSGDPTAGQGVGGREPGRREAVLKLALHLPETPTPSKETQIVLDLLPNREHGTFLHSSEGDGGGVGFLDLLDFMRKYQILLELCLPQVSKVRQFPLITSIVSDSYSIAHPSVNCTDDRGVFLSTSWQLKTNWTQSQVWDLSCDSVNYIFASDSTRSELKPKGLEKKRKILFF